MCHVSAAIVGPVIFGQLYDSSCLEWGDDGGACKLTDKETLRHRFLGESGLAAVIRRGTKIFAILVPGITKGNKILPSE